MDTGRLYKCTHFNAPKINIEVSLLTLISKYLNPLLSKTFVLATEKMSTQKRIEKIAVIGVSLHFKLFFMTL